MNHLTNRARVASQEGVSNAPTGLVRLHVRQGGKWRLYENFDPTSKEFAHAASPHDGAAHTARQLGERLLGRGEAEAFAVLPARRRTDSPTTADVIFLGHRWR